jgi:hypothetical protein
VVIVGDGSGDGPAPETEAVDEADAHVAAAVVTFDHSEEGDVAVSVRQR